MISNDLINLIAFILIIGFLYILIKISFKIIKTTVRKNLPNTVKVLDNMLLALLIGVIFFALNIFIDTDNLLSLKTLVGMIYFFIVLVVVTAITIYMSREINKLKYLKKK